MDVREFQEKRGQIVDQMRKLTEESGDNWTPENRTKFDEMDAEQQQLKTQIDDGLRVEQSRLLADDIEDITDRHDYRAKKAEGFTYRDQCNAFAKRSMGRQLDSTEIEALKAGGLREDDQGNMVIRLADKAPASIEELREQVRDINMRATTPQSTTAGAGGNLIDTVLRTSLEERLLAIGSARNYATVFRTARGGTYNVPCVDDTSSKAVITAENTTATVLSLAFTQKAMTDFRYTSFVQASFEVIQDSVINLPAFIGSALGTRLLRGTNEHFTTGSTTGGTPRGIRSEAGTGVSTSSNTLLNTTGAYDALVNLVHSVDPAYRGMGNFGWCFHDSALGEIKKITDTTGQPLWQPVLRAGEPDQLLGYPYWVNQDMTTLASGGATANTSWILFGYLGAYGIRDVMEINIMTLRERRAHAGQVEWVSHSRHDGRTLFGATANDVIKGLVGTT